MITAHRLYYAFDICPGYWAAIKTGHAAGIIKDPVHIRDLHATLFHSLGIDHERMSFKFQGLDERLTGVQPAKVVKEIFA